jgi:nucleoside-diphosphate-sugar epimerase
MNSLNGKRVLVTGGSGFIGSHVTRRLVSLGARVAITTKYRSVIDNVRVADLWSDLEVLEADLRNLDSLAQVRAFAPQVVIHMAAYNHVGDSFLHVNEALGSNAIGTANLLECYTDYERFVYISTSEVYGHQSTVPFVETMTPCPISPYAVAKYAGELHARMHMSHLHRPIAIVRPFNAFGPYQSPRAVISELIELCLTGQDVRCTEGKQTREFNFVTNLVEGILLAAVREEAVGQVINLGSGTEIAIRDLVTTIHELTGSSSKLLVGALPTRPTEIWRMFADNRRARDLLGWEPRVDFRAGLERTIRWYKDFLALFARPGESLQRLAAHPAALTD